MINTEGIIIRMTCSDISIQGRVTSGVKLMNLQEDESVAGIARVRERKEKEEGNGEISETAEGTEKVSEAEEEISEAQKTDE